MARKSGTKKKSNTGNSGEDVEMNELNVPDRSKRVRWDMTSDSREEAASGPADSDSVPSDKVCMAVFCQHGRLGCAYYDPATCVVSVLEDCREAGHYDLTKMLVEQSNPRVVITSSKSDDACISVLQDYAEAAGSIFQIRPHKEFAPAKGRERLLSLRLLTDLEGGVYDPSEALSEISESGLRGAYNFMHERKQASGNPNMKRWSATIRLANFASLDSAPLCLSSIGALIDFLARERAAESEYDGPEALEIQSIAALVLDEVMYINSDALHSLQVFESENHASMYSEKTKEGLSLFGIFNTTRTSLGRSLLRTWLLRPSLSLAVLEARHTAVECFLLPENTPAITALQTHLKGITNVPKTIKTLKCGKGTANDWQALVKFTYHSALLCDALSELYQCRNVEVVEKLAHVLDLRSLKEIGNVINKTIDWEESAEMERICIRPHIDEELDNRKHAYCGIDSVLSKVAQKISQAVPAEYATSLNVVYFPQLGFLITVPMLEEWASDAGIKVLEGWSFQFSSESHVYFKSKEMHDMDHHIGDLHSAIVDREIELVQELLEKIMPFHDSVIGICEVCAELDCLLAFAEAARSFDYRRPQMVEGSVINIVQGRHPLQELAVDAFVPNDARLVGGAGFGQSFNAADGLPSNSIVLCTGANACGKSVYLKQVALIQYMAQIGSFVPAESATLGIVDKIFTRVQTKESVSKVQSAFMIDLSQVSLALRNCTSRSLILLDEFGKGTIPTDGAGLFCGVVKHLLNRGADCPMVLATTHFHEVFRKDLLDPDTLPVTFLHMQVLFTTSSGDPLDTDGLTSSDMLVDSETGHRSCVSVPGERITYLYRVAPGLSYGSHAAQCAAMYGLPHRIVARARYVSELLVTYELGKLLEEQMSEEELLDLQNAEKVARRFLEWDLTSEEAAHQTGVKARLAQILGQETDYS
ncbi:muts domain V-domain-containing protein [Pisolithus croceorrhizus]|nr:muts domain V-domain-containing protein [Pisolithus croceorrhizus]KAI6130041.1 muts domain V-domain-containing protein [Pisolithus croceorrhizus]KAI6166655.1 muts domain V-domain-containing protein [Pisolithus thermaeus]